jgi:alpha-methylacyl-CoA racemase
MAVGALEPTFFREFCRLLPLDADESDRADPARWPGLRRKIAERFAGRTRAEWSARFSDTDACVAPVLSLAEAKDHEQLKARGTYTEVAGIAQPAPAPGFSRTPTWIRGQPGSDASIEEALASWAG